MKVILSALLILTVAACQFHVVVIPPTPPAHSPITGPQRNLVPTVTSTPDVTP